ncbi:MAG: Holliday junction branch migration protein RuvA [Chloroflexi bacterium]|nr:Holliday junction branch migration protein RuvA [Chloroflexota bacterium]
MIASISGDVLAVDGDSLVVQVGGVGLQVFVPQFLAKQTAAGQTIFLHTCLIVREESLTLYGFEDAEQKEFFLLFLGVNGIGPRTALSAVSALSPDVVRRAVWDEQADVFARIPGVGKKGAQKILLHLQGKVGQAVGVGEIGHTNIDVEIIDALTGLGYSVIEAQSALQWIPKDTAEDLEERLRIALSYFAR